MIVDASYIINASSLALVMRAFLSLGQHQDAYQTLKRHSTLARTMDHSQASDIITGAVQQLKTKASFHRSLVDIVLFCLQTMGKAADQDGHASEVVHVCLARSRTMLAFDVSPPHPPAAVMHVNVCQLRVCLRILQPSTPCISRLWHLSLCSDIQHAMRKSLSSDYPEQLIQWQVTSCEAC